METVNSAVDSALSTPELLGLILTPLCFDDLLEISLVSKFWHAAILSTPATQRTLLILPSKAFISNPQRLNRVSYSYCYSPLNSYLVWSFPLHDVPNPFFVSDPLFHCIVAPGQPHSPYHQYGCLVPSRSDFGPYTKFPFKSQSRSWRDMLVLESPKELMIKTLTIEETVKFRSPGWHRSRLGSWEWRWAENDDWKWVRNKTVVFGDGLRCGDVWDLVRGKKDEIGGDRVFSLFCRWRMEGVECRERKDTVVGLSAQIRVDAWYATTWKAWLRCLCGGDKENRKTRTWREWFRSLVGARKRVDGKVTNRSGPFFGEHYLYRMKNNEDAVLEVIIVKTCSRWKIWRWFRPWKKTNSAQLEKLGFVREADPLIRILNF